MQTHDMITNQISRTVPVDPEETEELRLLVKHVLEKAQEAGLTIPEDRWPALGNHLIYMIRRFKTGAALPPLDSDLFDQISPAMRLLGREIVGSAAAMFGGAPDDAEILLLAIHFETARQVQ